VDLPAGGVAVVAAHAQVVSPRLRVKRSHSTNDRRRLLFLKDWCARVTYVLWF